MKIHCEMATEIGSNDGPGIGDFIGEIPVVMPIEISGSQWSAKANDTNGTSEHCRKICCLCQER